jgi:transcriptional regulator with XRE-family HTH domain
MIFFHTNLRYICKRFGVTQESLAVHMKKTQTTIGNWQSGKSQPSLEELLILSSYFSVDLTTLIAIDIGKNNLIKEENIKNFNTKRQLRLNVRDSVIKGATSNSYDYHIPESQVSDEDKTTNWVVLNELRNLSQKIDYVKASIEKIARRKEGK